MNEKATDHIAALIAAIMQPAMAGGLKEEKAKKIYETIMSSISNLHPSHDQFKILLNDLISKWALPIIKESNSPPLDGTIFDFSSN